MDHETTKWSACRGRYSAVGSAHQYRCNATAWLRLSYFRWHMECGSYHDAGLASLESLQGFSELDEEQVAQARQWAAGTVNSG